VKRTRRLLLRAFTELAQEKGISTISVQDMAERATVNRATFYAHFEDKYALMDSWMREEFQQELARKIPASATLSAHNLRVLILSVFDFLARFYSSCKRTDAQFEPMFETAMQQELYDVLLGWLKQGTSSGSSAEALQTTAQVVSWAIFGPAVQWSRGQRIRSSEEMSRDVLAVVLASLSGVVSRID
jgi:AcrR family transcriptional regulator